MNKLATLLLLVSCPLAFASSCPDANLRDAISARGVKVEVTTTIMADPDDALRLARVILA